MIDRVQFVNEMKRALDLPDSYNVDIEEPVCPVTTDEILDPDGFDLKFGEQVFHFNMRNNTKLSEQILKVDVIPLKTKNEVVSLMKQVEAEYTVNGVTFKMIRVTGGTFQMGGSDSDELPLHEVLVNSFSIGQTQVTQELWKAVMGSNPSSFKGDKKPVEQVCWNDCQTFIQKLNQLTGKQFRLPTEAEWEFAARGGTQRRIHSLCEGVIDDLAWYYRNSNDTTHDVATKYPNELGIFDMGGNVWELCQDWYSRDYYSNSAINNPIGPVSGDYRVCRGGSYRDNWYFCFVYRRNSFLPDYRNSFVGLRLAL